MRATTEASETRSKRPAADMPGRVQLGASSTMGVCGGVLPGVAAARREAGLKGRKDLARDCGSRCVR